MNRFQGFFGDFKGSLRIILVWGILKLFEGSLNHFQGFFKDIFWLLEGFLANCRSFSRLLHLFKNFFLVIYSTDSLILGKNVIRNALIITMNFTRTIADKTSTFFLSFSLFFQTFPLIFVFDIPHFHQLWNSFYSFIQTSLTHSIEMENWWKSTSGFTCFQLSFHINIQHISNVKCLNVTFRLLDIATSTLSQHMLTAVIPLTDSNNWFI